MGTVIKKFLDWIDLQFWLLAQRQREQALQWHFQRMHPGTVVDIDKYLRALQDRGLGQ
jgi:hypothetical protein